jgi:orotate phosphoribosyltransferase
LTLDNFEAPRPQPGHIRDDWIRASDFVILSSFGFGHSGFAEAPMYDRQRLIELFHERAPRFGEFTLVSGQKSSYYLDGKQVTLHAEGLRLVSEGLLDLLAGLDFSAIGGMSIGADPIIGGVLAVAAARGRALQGFLVRKEAKGHGTQRYIEGPVKPGERVVIVDDVATTGGSSLLAAERATEYGCQVVQAVAIVDRLQGAAANFADRGIPFRALLTVEAFGIRT